MPDSRDEKRATTAFLNTYQDVIYNLYVFRGFTTDEIQRELVWNLKLGWVSYGRLQATIKSWRESSRPMPWPERTRGLIDLSQMPPSHDPSIDAVISQPQPQPQPQPRPATFSTFREGPTPVSRLHKTDPAILLTSTMGVARAMASSNSRPPITPHIHSHMTMHDLDQNQQQQHQNQQQHQSQQQHPSFWPGYTEQEELSVAPSAFTSNILQTVQPESICHECHKIEVVLGERPDLAAWQICTCA